MFRRCWFAYYLVLTSFLITTLASCKKDEAKDLTVEEKILFDSLKTIAFKDIRSKTDTLCSQVKDSLFNVYVDSLLTLRMSEIQQLFEETNEK